MARTSETTPLNGDGGLRSSSRSGGSRRGSRHAHRYAAVPVSEVAAREVPSGSVGTRRRAFGAVGVLLAFGLAVSTLQQQQQQQMSKPVGNTYRGMLQQVREQLIYAGHFWGRLLLGGVSAPKTEKRYQLGKNIVDSSPLSSRHAYYWFRDTRFDRRGNRVTTTAIGARRIKALSMLSKP